MMEEIIFGIVLIGMIFAMVVLYYAAMGFLLARKKLKITFANMESYFKKKIDKSMKEFFRNNSDEIISLYEVHLSNGQ